MHTSIHVAGTRHDISRGLVAGAAIYNLADIDPARQHLLLELADDRDVPLRPDDYIVINGRERFSIADGPQPADDNPCLRKPLSPTINEQELPADRELHQAKLTFEQLAALDPDFESGDGVFVELKDVPDAQVLPGMRVLVQNDDRFYMSPCGNVGFEPKLDADLALLRERCGSVECIDDGTRRLVIARDQELPAHWNRRSTDILLQVPQGYPLAALDMFWVTPGLALADGRQPQNADQLETYAARTWQRFSWHYPPGHRWNPATDGILSHLRFARVRLGQAH
jgi:hypothetical protein